MARVDTRSELISLLSDACELEHSLACAYLYAAFSLRAELDEGLDWRAQQIARQWAAQLYFVASQEMMHLAQAWNLLTAVGGVPYYGRPRFPQSPKYYPLDLALELAPFSATTLDRFIRFERPEDPSLHVEHEGIVPDEEFAYQTVGNLYGLIRDGFRNMRESLFVGDVNAQLGPEDVDFPMIVRVVDAESASTAIDVILLQGEGAPANRRDCHYGIFTTMRCQLEDNKEAFSFAFPAARNPVARRRPEDEGRDVKRILNPLSIELALLFDDVYVLMLRMLGSVFAGALTRAHSRALSCSAIELMVTVLKPLGEGLARLPLERGSDARAGAPFDVVRHVPLPPDPKTAAALVDERFGDLIFRAKELLSVYPRLAAAIVGLERCRATAAGDRKGRREVKHARPY